MYSLLKLSVLILLALAARAEDRWVLLSTPHFEVLTDAGEGKGREVLRRFEQIRGVLLSATQFRAPPAQPVRVFVFRGESEFAEYRDPGRKSMAGFYRSDRYRDFIAMQDTGADIYRVVFHEYVHLVLSHSGIPLPLWLDEGIAELFSTLETSGRQAKIGGVIPSHLATLRHQKMLEMSMLMQVNLKSAAYNEQNKVGIFYAESWAFVHMLSLSDKYAPGLQPFLELMLTGTPQTEALEHVYGRSSNEVFRDLQDYISREQFLTRPLKPAPFEEIGTVEPKQLTPPESSLALADLLINLGKSQAAEHKLNRLTRDYPNTPVIEEGLGDAALGQHRQDDALAHYQRAINLGSKSARVYFEVAALLRENQSGLAPALEHLQKALALDPNYSQARDLLASLEFANKSAEPSTPRFETHLSPEAVPKSWQNRKGDRRIEGKLVQVECLGKGARLHVRVATQKIALQVADPSKVVLTNAAGTTEEFACGTMQPRDVVVEYIAKPNAELKTAGEITAIEFR